MSESYSVSITTDGRSGYVTYSEGLTHRHAFYWEFGGDDVVASINVPHPDKWDREVTWAKSRRTEVLQRLAAEVQRQQCQTCTPEIGDDWIQMVKRS